MSWRTGDVWACLAFDLDGKVADRSVRTGAGRFVVDEIIQAASSRASARARFELGGLILAQPSFLDPDEVTAAVRDALALRLPPGFADLIPDNNRSQLWCRRE
jgi:hypothetical protein